MSNFSTYWSTTLLTHNNIPLSSEKWSVLNNWDTEITVLLFFTLTWWLVKFYSVFGWELIKYFIIRKEYGNHSLTSSDMVECVSEKKSELSMYYNTLYLSDIAKNNESSTDLYVQSL